jgi:hypothetical protein
VPQFEPIEFSTNLGFEMLGQATAIASLERIQPRPSIATQRLIPGCALREEQSFDPVDVLDRSMISTLRSRQIRRRSSSSGVGARTIEQTRGSPRLWARSARSKVSPSILSIWFDQNLRDRTPTWRLRNLERSLR